MIRVEFTGMLPGAIEKFEKLLEVAANLKPKISVGKELVDIKSTVSAECETCPLQLKDARVLKSAAADLSKPKILKGYDASMGKDSHFYWGVACRIQYADMKALRSEAEALGITWLSDDGDMAYVDGLKIDDFKSFRVNGALKLTMATEILPKKEGM